MATIKKSRALILRVLAAKKGDTPSGRALASRANKEYIDAQRLQRVQKALERARRGKSLFGLRNAD
jgi:hypothetical protein